MKFHHPLLLLLVAVIGPAGAKSPGFADGYADESSNVWIVEFDRPSLVDSKMQALGPVRPSRVLIDESDDAALGAITATQNADTQSLFDRLGRDAVVVGRYRVTGNGVALRLSAAEADLIADHAMVKSIARERMYRLHTDAGPDWIQAPLVWDGGNRGEGVVVGILDGIVNWDHPAFADIGGDGYDHDNPTGQLFGLCGQSGVTCNDKLIGVYNFTSEEVVAPLTNSHGSHVASTAAGNVREATLNGQAVTLSGVAPHANIISYKVCLDDNASDQGGCPTSAILAALDQAVLDGVDVINMSLGGGESNPWTDSFSQRVLAARQAGILSVTSAGNSGPGAGSIGSPGADPWVLSVANVTHHRGPGNIVQDLTGGASPQPGDLVGSGRNGPFGPGRIVHARDFGNALCGAGDPELLSSCEAHSGVSNPFAAGTFDGEIVVCDRGVYGRIEKSFNVRAAGAGGFILANTGSQGEQINSDEHCLPGVHLGQRAGDELRDWLARGQGHQGRISGSIEGFFAEFGDNVNRSSSRGPSQFAANQIKPDVAAPGTAIFAAFASGATEGFLSGTSMASPHVAGLVALLKSARPELAPDELHSLVVGSARNDGMLAQGGTANGFDVGAGRARADLAIRGGLAMLTADGMFRRGNGVGPAIPLRDMNLPGLVDNDCRGRCSFTRTVTDIAGGGTWSVRTEGPLSVDVNQFTLSNGASRDLVITADLAEAGSLGQWNDGAVILTPNNNALSAFQIPARIFASVGPMPAGLSIATDQSRGSQLLGFDELIALPNIGYRVTALVAEQSESPAVAPDTSNQDPYDSIQGTERRFFAIGAGGALIARTLQGTSSDIDLYVGVDSNGDGLPSEAEELCRSVSPTSAEQCELTNLTAGTYWLVVQNWSSPNTTDALDFSYAAIDGDNGSLVATGPRQTLANGEDFDARIAWNAAHLSAGETGLGFVYLTAGESAQVVGSVPVTLTLAARASGASAAVLDRQLPTLLVDGVQRDIALEPNEGHGRLFMELPAQTDFVDIIGSASEPVEFIVSNQPLSFAAPDVPLVDVSGLSGTTTQSFNQRIDIGATPQGSRLYVVPVNRGDGVAAVSLTVTQGPSQQGVASASFVEPLQGMYFNPQRDGAGLNLNYDPEGNLALQWYTYLEDGTPTWYLANGLFRTNRDQWVGDLGFFNYDGSEAAFVDVGDIVLTWQSASRFVMSFDLNGRSGTEPYQSIEPNFSCQNEGPAAEVTGLWYLPAQAGFGYSVWGLAQQQIQINYLYDAQGFPRWVLGQGTPAETAVVSQFTGFCPSCESTPIRATEVGTNQLSIDRTGSGSAATQLEFQTPVRGVWQSNGPAANLLPTVNCRS